MGQPPVACYNLNNQYNTVLSSSILYDADGNLLNDTFHTYSWDAYGHASTIDSTTCGTNGTCLTYDALGRMVEKSVNSTYTEVLYSPMGKTAIMVGQTTSSAYFPLPAGETLYETGSSGGTQYFWHKDWLGSVRFASTLGGRASYFDRAFAPFGETYDNFGNTSGNNFTGDTQDTISGTYDTPNRELNPNQGRWVSPDPAGLGAVDPGSPQSWNRYSYVGNNPTSFVDPSGLVDINPGLLYGMMGGGGFGCQMDGLDTTCQMAYTALEGGGAAQCPNNNCSAQYIGGQWQNFGAWADGSSGYMPGSLAGFSTLDAANALAMVKAAGRKLGTPIDPASLTGWGALAYKLLTGLGVAPGDITIYQNDGGDFEAVLSAQGFKSLMSGLDSNPGDAFLHYPYTDGARDSLDVNSLHGVWFDPNLTNYVGGSGVYMQFHIDADNPWQGSMWNHMVCVLFKAGCQ